MFPSDERVGLGDTPCQQVRLPTVGLLGSGQVPGPASQSEQAACGSCAGSLGLPSLRVWWGGSRQWAELLAASVGHNGRHCLLGVDPGLAAAAVPRVSDADRGARTCHSGWAGSLRLAGAGWAVRPAGWCRRPDLLQPREKRPVSFAHNLLSPRVSPTSLLLSLPCRVLGRCLLPVLPT